MLVTVDNLALDKVLVHRILSVLRSFGFRLVPPVSWSHCYFRLRELFLFCSYQIVHSKPSWCEIQLLCLFSSHSFDNHSLFFNDFFLVPSEDLALSKVESKKHVVISRPAYLIVDVFLEAHTSVI
jgi:hypothetical protein